MPSSNTPVLVLNNLKFLTLAAGSVYTCGLTTDYKTYCWGSNSSNQFGNGNNTSSGVPVAAFSGWEKL